MSRNALVAGDTPGSATATTGHCASLKLFIISVRVSLEDTTSSRSSPPVTVYTVEPAGASTSARKFRVCPNELTRLTATAASEEASTDMNSLWTALNSPPPASTGP